MKQGLQRTELTTAWKRETWILGSVFFPFRLWRPLKVFSIHRVCRLSWSEKEGFSSDSDLLVPTFMLKSLWPPLSVHLECEGGRALRRQGRTYSPYNICCSTQIATGICCQGKDDDLIDTEITMVIIILTLVLEKHIHEKCQLLAPSQNVML